MTSTYLHRNDTRVELPMKNHNFSNNVNCDIIQLNENSFYLIDKHMNLLRTINIADKYKMILALFWRVVECRTSELVYLKCELHE